MSRATEMHGFLPEDYVESKIQRRTNLLWALIFMIVAGSIGWAYFIVQAKIQQAEAENAEVNREFADAAEPIQQFKQMQEEQKRLNTKAELVGSLKERVNRSNILAEITNALPPNVYLSDCDLTGTAETEAMSKAAKTALELSRGPSGVKPLVYDVKIKLKGFAMTNSQVSDYCTNLEKCGLFSDVVFGQTTETVYKERKLRAFELELTLDRNADTRVARTTLR